METITSDRNPLLREVRKALARGELMADGACAVESVHLLEEAIRSKRPVKTVLAAQSAAPNLDVLRKSLIGAKVILLADALFHAVATTETTQGIIALVEPPAWSIDDVFTGPAALAVVLDGLQDPGNAGNIVRTAEAFGATGVLFLKGSVSPYNPKTQRAAAGSLFRLPYVSAVAVDVARSVLAAHQLDIYAAMPKAERTIAEANLTRPVAMIIGSEGQGVSPAMLASAQPLRIPTRAVESLNAAMAAGILLYEAARQRSVR